MRVAVLSEASTPKGAVEAALVTLDLVDALLGDLPPQLSYGLTPEHVETVLGEGDVFVNGRTRISKYGGLELWFGDTGLERISTHLPTDGLTGSQGLRVEPGWLDQAISVRDTFRYLEPRGVSLSTVIDPMNDGCVDVLIGTTGVLKFQMLPIEVVPSVWDENLGLRFILAATESYFRHYCKLQHGVLWRSLSPGMEPPG